jgi:hypothetical protein
LIPHTPSRSAQAKSGILFATAFIVPKPVITIRFFFCIINPGKNPSASCFRWLKLKLDRAKSQINIASEIAGPVFNIFIKKLNNVL